MSGTKRPGRGANQHMGADGGGGQYILCRSGQLSSTINWCFSNTCCHCEPVRLSGVAIPRLEGKCIDNCPTEQGNAAIPGGNRYLVPINRGIATTSVRTGLAMTALFSNTNLPPGWAQGCGFSPRKMAGAWSEAALLRMYLIRERSKRMQPQCPRKVGKQVIFNQVPISGL